jgi:hypothetical protein
MRKLLSVLGALLLAGLLAPSAHAAPGDRVLVYGDSLTAEAKPYVEGFVRSVGGTGALVRGAPGGATCDLFDLMGYDGRHEHPAVVVIQFSGNNVSRCMQDGRGKPLQGAAWLAKYRADTLHAIQLLRPTRAQIWLATSPISLLADKKGEDDVHRLAAMYRDIAAHTPGVHVTDAAAAVLAFGRYWTRTMPCLRNEPCTQVDTNAQRANQVRANDGVHFCPAPYPNGGTCPVWSSGALRFAVGLVLPGMRATGMYDHGRFERSTAAGWGE